MSAVAEPSLVVHHLDNSRSQRVLWLLEELKVPYTIKTYFRQPDQRAPKELFAVHPLGKSPVVTDGDVVVAESGAIIEYLLRTYDKEGKFKPAESEWLTNTYFTHFAEGTMMPHIVFKHIMALAPTHTPWPIRPILGFITGTIARLAVDESIVNELKLVEAHLSKIPPNTNTGFAGSPGVPLTSADFMMIFPLETILALAPDMVREHKNILAYTERIHSLDAWKRGIEKGGKYALA